MTSSTVKVNVLIPKKGQVNNIKNGSGIVSLQNVDEHRIWYEGNLYGAENLKTLEDRVMLAASRAITKAPTVAFDYVPPAVMDEKFIKVGEYCYQSKTLTLNSDYEQEWKEWEALYSEVA